MEPTEKNPAIDSFLSKFTGKDRRSTIRSNVCMFCGKEANSFRDPLSEREYAISGLCQKCQDATFGVEEDE